MFRSHFCLNRWRIWNLIASHQTPRTVLWISLGRFKGQPSGSYIFISTCFLIFSINLPRSGISTGTTGHYTQVVWAESSRLGCGKRGKYVVCNYLGGNMSGSSIYKRVSLILSNILLLFSALMVHCIDFPTYYDREVPAQHAQKDQLVQMGFVELNLRVFLHNWSL